MTDLQKFMDLYKDVGVKVELEYSSDGSAFLMLEPSVQEKIGGQGCYTQIKFDTNGKFVEQNFYPLGEDY